MRIGGIKAILPEAQMYWTHFLSICCLSISSICLFLNRESQYSFDQCRVFDTGNDPDITTALIASFDINIKYMLQSFCPGHGSLALDGGLVLIK